MKDWWVDDNVVAESSADKTAKGKHCCRSSRLIKQSYEALVPNFCNIRSAITATYLTFVIHVCKLP